MAKVLVLISEEEVPHRLFSHEILHRLAEATYLHFELFSARVSNCLRLPLSVYRPSERYLKSSVSVG